jgi:hypothetical protein
VGPLENKIKASLKYTKKEPKLSESRAGHGSAPGTAGSLDPGQDGDGMSNILEGSGFDI